MAMPPLCIYFGEKNIIIGRNDAQNFENEKTLSFKLMPEKHKMMTKNRPESVTLNCHKANLSFP